MTTIRELTKAIRSHKGKVEVPVLTPQGVMHMIAEKTDLLAAVRSYNQSVDDPAPFYVVSVKDGYMRLDVQGE